MRRSGVLMPVSSLPSRFGIGGFSKEAYDFVDFLAASGQSLWQILPLGPTGYGDSPYQSFSTFAGSPYYISLDALIEEGLLTEEECSSVDFGNDTKRVDYEKIYHTRFDLLRKAFERANTGDDADYNAISSASSFSYFFIAFGFLSRISSLHSIHDTPPKESLTAMYIA